MEFETTQTTRTLESSNYNLNLNKNQINNCDDSSDSMLKQFAKYYTESSQLNIKFNHDNNLSNQTSSDYFRFMLQIKLLKTDAKNRRSSSAKSCRFMLNEMECQSQFRILDNDYTQMSCLNKDLICNCASFSTLSEDDQKDVNYVNMDRCNYLLVNFGNFLHSLSYDREKLCAYYLELNKKCLNYTKTNEFEIEEEEDKELYHESSVDDYFINIDHKQKQQEEKENAQSSNSINYYDRNCFSVFRTNEYGWIASPNFYSNQNTYETNLTCSYHIIMQPYQTVQLRFKSFYFNRPVAQQNENNLADSLSIYDGAGTGSTLLARFTHLNNDFSRNFFAKTINSKSNSLFIVFSTHSSSKNPQNSTANGIQPSNLMNKMLGFNFTYQIKGYCIEDQKQCNSFYELNCYSPEQRCNDAFDCQNGMDERGCEPCKADQFKCKNHIFCYKFEERCDGDYNCIDKYVISFAEMFSGV
jgi:hypothetical protein